MENICPNCQAQLDWQNEGYCCQSCAKAYEKNAFCNKCENLVEKLKACGAVQYFCNHCNELKSKSAVRLIFSAK